MKAAEKSLEVKLKEESTKCIHVEEQVDSQSKELDDCKSQNASLKRDLEKARVEFQSRGETIQRLQSAVEAADKSTVLLKSRHST